MKQGWRRSSKAHPCPVCGRPNHEHTSRWCIHTTDGAVAICPFVESRRRIGDAGWLHRIGGGAGRSIHHRPPKPIAATIRFDQLTDVYEARCNGMISALASELNVSEESLKLLRVGWNGTAATFPMYNARGMIIGIRLRFPSAEKKSIRGGRQGCFVPTVRRDGLTLLCEGPTDTAAALTLGFDAIGRPSSLGGDAYIPALCRDRRCVVIADNDDAGMRGARRLAKGIGAPIVAPPDGIKDLRAWIGVTHARTVRDIIARS